MMADRRTSSNGTLLNPYHPPKIHRAGSYLFGSAGTARLGSLFREFALEVRAAGSATWPDWMVFRQIVRLVRDQPPNERFGQAHALVLSHEGIWEIGSDGSVNQCDPECQVWAVGSGYQAALGFLEGVLSQRPGGASWEEWRRDAFSSEAGRKAIYCAGLLNADVGDGIQLEQLEPEPSGSPPEAPAT